MQTIEVVGFKRANLGKKDAKDLRLEGNVPAVLYGGEEQVHFYAPAYLFRDLVYTPNVYFVKLNIEGTEYKAVLQDTQFHPVSENLLHADFLLVNDDKPMKMELPVVFEGSSPGVAVGGRLVTKLRKIKVKALPNALPDNIKVDISTLELGKSVKVGEVPVEGLEILNNPTISIATVEIPRALRSKQSAGEDGSEEA
ncbi:50S ribosomal protein L25/general stress protein Ctc [Persicobacter psychrovividus]|uniref:Large ribosomal subunit protein bL25 n=1 Tax=Persicobacter psychrovividus TaxID=387638 RepID=A0ABN6L6V1_9BACT|nr:50S ribosomal protein L25 [Persicobacter psychrovividus]